MRKAQRGTILLSLFLAAVTVLALTSGVLADKNRAGSLDVEGTALDNGMKIYLAPRGEVPIVTFEAMIVAGTMDEPADKAGLSFAVGELLNRGTASYTAQELANTLDNLGADLSVNADYDYTTVTLSILSKDSEKGLEMLREVLDHATFADEEVERKRSEVAAYLEQLKDNYVDVVRKDFYRLIYGEHPYYRPQQGTEESVAAMTPKDLRDFYSTYFVPNNISISAVGQFDPKEMAGLLRSAFGDWKSGDIPPRTPPPMPEPRWQVETIQRDVTQATIRMGQIGLARNHPDYTKARLMNYILGGSGFGSRLMANLREDRGLTYGVYSNFWPRKDKGYFFASTQAINDSMNVAIREILKEIKLLQDKGVTADELKWAKMYYTGNMPLQLQSNDQLAHLVLEQQFYGLENEFWLKEIEEMQTMTREDLQQAAKDLITPEKFTIVVLANFETMALDYK
ncbi:MAG: insulinase family protein [Candidatus Eisenbacteria bacterium]|uniref:Insulinase family protein n=1 Tax=Eiseniibacteriota bacterium TaxID=2212470 RepID=A0A948RVY3_UNCEI|nr:insulinase family protein [Candidatus Eisenbacteria bacterium]MBU2689967.1 insulinase family protein [Candidatus Eisenbacteria bacterium]